MIVLRECLQSSKACLVRSQTPYVRRGHISFGSLCIAKIQNTIIPSRALTRLFSNDALERSSLIGSRRDRMNFYWWSILITSVKSSMCPIDTAAAAFLLYLDKMLACVNLMQGKHRSLMTFNHWHWGWQALCFLLCSQI